MTIGLLGGQGGLLGAEANILGGILGGGKAEGGKAEGGLLGGLLGGIINAKMGLVEGLLGGVFNALTGGLLGGDTKKEEAKPQPQQKPQFMPMQGGFHNNFNQATYQNQMNYNVAQFNQGGFNIGYHQNHGQMHASCGSHGVQNLGMTIHISPNGQISAHTGNDHYFHSFQHQGASYPMYGVAAPAFNPAGNASLQNGNWNMGMQMQPMEAVNPEQMKKEEKEEGGMNPLGFLGGIFKTVHHIAEFAIDLTGLQPLFAPIDAAIIHPLLWDPLSAITGVDVADHPEGIPDVKK